MDGPLTATTHSIAFEQELLTLSLSSRLLLDRLTTLIERKTILDEHEITLIYYSSYELIEL